MHDQADWAMLRRLVRPAVQNWLNDLTVKPGFAESRVVDANDPWLDDLIDLLPPGPERLLLYGDIASLVEFHAALNQCATMRVCLALGTSAETRKLLEGHGPNWISVCYVGSPAGWQRSGEHCIKEKPERLAIPGDVFIARTDDFHGECMGYDCDKLREGPLGQHQRLVLRVMTDG